MISIYEFLNPRQLQSRNKRFQMWKTKASFLYAFMNCLSINLVRLFIPYKLIAQFL